MTNILRKCIWTRILQVQMHVVCALLISFAGSFLNVVQNMNDSIAHRGPDNNSVKWLNENCVFGHVRLSILDTSEASNQLHSKTLQI